MPAFKSSLRNSLLAAVALLSAGCGVLGEPQPFRASFSLRSLGTKPLPLPQGGWVLIGDSLFIDEGAERPHDGGQASLRAVVEQLLPDGTTRVDIGYMMYERRGDTVVTSFYCRFGDVCPLISVAPDIGILRNDSLIFAGHIPEEARVYLRFR